MIKVLLTQKGWPGRKRKNQIWFAPIFILYDPILTDQKSGGLADPNMFEIRNSNLGLKWVWISSHILPKLNALPKFPYKSKVSDDRIRTSFCRRVREYQGSHGRHFWKRSTAPLSLLRV